MRPRTRLTFLACRLTASLSRLGSAADTYTCVDYAGPGGASHGRLFHLNNSGLVAAQFNNAPYTFSPATRWAPLTAGVPAVGYAYVCPWGATYWGYEQGFIDNPGSGTYMYPPSWYSAVDPAVIAADPGLATHYLTEFDGVGNNGLVGGGLSSTQQREAIVHVPAPTGIQSYLFSLPGSVLMARAINDQDVDSATNCPSNTDSCVGIAGWISPWNASGTPHGPLAYPNLGTPSSITPAGAFVFSVSIQNSVTTYYIDPPPAVGYDYSIAKGDSRFASVVLPILGQGSNRYTLVVGDRAFIVAAGQKFDFTTNGSDAGVAKFRVLGIDLANRLDPTTTTAFVTGVSFTGAGHFAGTMMPQTATTELTALRHTVDEMDAGDALAQDLHAAARYLNLGSGGASCRAMSQFVTDVTAYSFHYSATLAQDLTQQALAIENALGCH